MSQRSKYCLVGVPDHQGVLNVGGRVGAASGPAAFRRCWARLKGRSAIDAELDDLGDVQGMTDDVPGNHRLAAAAVRDAHRRSGVSVVVGGGHDHGYSHLLGVKQSLPKGARLGCINIDAHLDVRKPTPLVTSGSPFYLALESGTIEPSSLVEFGIQSHCNARELWEYADRKKIGVVPFDKLRGGGGAKVFEQALARLGGRCDAVVVSLDLDAVAEAFAPGVSAPQAEGFTSSEIVRMAELAGRSRKVVSLGLFELNPMHDIGDRTARLCATAAWHFLEQVDARAASRSRKK